MSIRMNRTTLFLGLLLGALVAGGVYWWQRAPTTAQVGSNLSLAEAMGGDTTGYLKADAPRTFVFPEDHGPHSGFKTEWWYYTGNLNATDGQHYGFQFTLFRIALIPPDTRSLVRTSAWATEHLYMGHFALSDIQNEQFYAFERFSREAAALAGAQNDPFRVWLEGWEATSIDSSGFPMRVRAQQDGVGIDLLLTPAKPMVLQGDNGLDPKGAESGNASYYYSATRLSAQGTVTINDDPQAVAGLAWMDREWSTSALGDDQVGWDWFALQLSDGRDLMYYQLRNQDGTADAESDGVLVAADGSKTTLRRDDVQLEVLDSWTSPLGGTYPSGWRLVIPSQALDLTVTPSFKAQELDVSVRYWEGAVFIEGTTNGQPVEGSGYVELTGYADAATGRAPS